MRRLPWNLCALEGEARVRRFEVLADWVGWMVEHYGVGRLIPPCWWRHPAMVEELSALELSWSSAYEGDGTDRDAPLRWHEDFQKARERLAEWDRQGCAAGGHRDRKGPPRDREDPAPKAAADSHVRRNLTAALRPNEGSAERFRDSRFMEEVFSGADAAAHFADSADSERRDDGADAAGDLGC